jgi:hypothetical protein
MRRQNSHVVFNSTHKPSDVNRAITTPSTQTNLVIDKLLTLTLGQLYYIVTTSSSAEESASKIRMEFGIADKNKFTTGDYENFLKNYLHPFQHSDFYSGSNAENWEIINELSKTPIKQFKSAFKDKIDINKINLILSEMSDHVDPPDLNLNPDTAFISEKHRETTKSDNKKRTANTYAKVPEAKVSNEKSPIIEWLLGLELQNFCDLLKGKEIWDNAASAIKNEYAKTHNKPESSVMFTATQYINFITQYFSPLTHNNLRLWAEGKENNKAMGDLKYVAIEKFKDKYINWKSIEQNKNKDLFLKVILSWELNVLIEMHKRESRHRKTCNKNIVASKIREKLKKNDCEIDSHSFSEEHYDAFLVDYLKPHGITYAMLSGQGTEDEKNKLARLANVKIQNLSSPTEVTNEDLNSVKSTQTIGFNNKPKDTELNSHTSKRSRDEETDNNPVNVENKQKIARTDDNKQAMNPSRVFRQNKNSDTTSPYQNNFKKK